MRQFIAAVVVAISLATYTLADSPFLIPGIDPFAVSVSELGVGADGATTWAVVPLTEDPDNSGISGTATVVAGPTRAEIIYNDPTGGLSQHESCNIVDGDVFECTLVYAVEGETTTVFGTETVASYLAAAQQTNAQGGSSGGPSGAPASGSAPTPTPPPVPSGSSSQAPTSSGQSQSGSSQSGSQSTVAPAPTNPANGAPGLASGMQAVGMLAIALTYMFL